MDNIGRCAVCMACQVSLYNLALRVSVIPQRKPQIILSVCNYALRMLCNITQTALILCSVNKHNNNNKHWRLVVIDTLFRNKMRTY